VTPSSAFFGYKYITEFGFTGDGEGGFESPRDVTITDDRIFVLDSSQDRVQIFDHSLNFISQFGSTGSGDGEFNSPTHIVSNSTHVLVLDQSNYRVQIFDLNGTYKAQFGEYYHSDGEIGQFSTLGGLEITDTNIYVTDFIWGRVHIFDLAGNPVGDFYTEELYCGIIASNGTALAIHKSMMIQDIWIYDLEGNLLFELDDTVFPFSMIADIVFIGNLLIVADGGFNNYYNRIVAINLLDNSTVLFGTTGNGPGEFGSISGLGVNETRLLATDRGNNNTKVFEIDRSIKGQIPNTVTETVTETLEGETVTETTQLDAETVTEAFTDGLPLSIPSLAIGMLVTIIVELKRRK
jgi:hypothetical protein